jgi:hypothetical protein
MLNVGDIAQPRYIDTDRRPSERPQNVERPALDYRDAEFAKRLEICWLVLTRPSDQFREPAPRGQCQASSRTPAAHPDR